MQPDYHEEGFSLMFIWVIRKDTYKEELEGEDVLVRLPPAQDTGARLSPHGHSHLS